MNKKGFTLVELLAVIVVMALLVTIAVPNVIAISRKIRVEMFCDKVDMILDGAKLYGSDNYDLIKDKINATGDTESKISITVTDLLNNNYVTKDDKNGSINSPTNPCIKDPRDNSSMDSKVVELGIRNKRVYATYNYTNEEKEACKIQ